VIKVPSLCIGLTSPNDNRRVEWFQRHRIIMYETLFHNLTLIGRCPETYSVSLDIHTML
jgi:hypothetical protein